CDVPAHEHLPFTGLAAADFQPTKRGAARPILRMRAVAAVRQHAAGEVTNGWQFKNEQEQERHMDRTTARDNAHPGINTPPIVSPAAWEVARQQMLVKEKALMRARDALAAERRRMPWMAVEQAYEFDGPEGKISLLDLFDGRRQLVIYRAFFEPGVFGWPEHACRGCSLGADQVAHLAHLNA